MLTFRFFGGGQNNMKILTAALFTILAPTLASATKLTYELDLAQTGMEESVATGLCGLPKIIELDAKEDLATVAIKKTQASNPADLEIDFIQASEGSQTDGELKEPYAGDYRDRVAISRLKSAKDAFHSKGYYRRVEVFTYGSKAAPKSFIIYSELINYRESAEMSEDSLCTGIAYRLK